VLTSANGPRRKEEYKPPAAEAPPPPPPPPKRAGPKGGGSRQKGAKPPPKSIPAKQPMQQPTPQTPKPQHSQPPQQVGPPKPQMAKPPAPPRAAPPPQAQDEESEEDDGYGSDSFEDYGDDDFDDESDGEGGVPPAPPKVDQPDWMNVGPPPAELKPMNSERPAWGSIPTIQMSPAYSKRCFEQEPISQFDQLSRQLGCFAGTANSSVQTTTNSQTAETQTEMSTKSPGAAQESYHDSDDFPMNPGRCWDHATRVALLSDPSSASVVSPGAAEDESHWSSDMHEVSCQVINADPTQDTSSAGVYLSASGPAKLRREFDPMHLARFLRSATQAMVALLGESEAAKQAALDLKIEQYEGNVQLTMGCIQLPNPPIGGLRPITDLRFSNFHQEQLLVAYGPAEYGLEHGETIEQVAQKLSIDLGQIIFLNSARYPGISGSTKLQPGSRICVPTGCTSSLPSATGGKGLLCLWDVNALTAPIAVLVCEAHPSTCCFSAHSLSMSLYAATADGSLIVWDLQEEPEMHISCKVPGGNPITLRRPSYSTDGMMDEGHLGPVCKLQAVATGSNNASDQTSEQLATLDQMGGLCVWMVMRLNRGDVAGSEADLCLGIGSRVKVLKSFSLDLSAHSRALDFEFRPGNSNHVVVGTGVGKVVHTVRHGRKAAPAEYEGSGVCDVLTVQFSPFLPEYLLAAFSSGDVSLYHQENPLPVHSWKGFSQSPLVGAFWLPSQPQAFLVHNQAGEVFVFDLVKDSSFPVSTSKFEAKGSAFEAAMTKVAVSCAGVGHPYMATAFSSGSVSVHTLSGMYSSSSISDKHRMLAMLEGRKYVESMYDEPVKERDHRQELEAFENDNFDVLESMGGMGGGMGDMFGVVATTGRKAKSGRRAK